jgi:DNA topoisomerase-1
VRDQTKYDRMIAFGEALPLIRARVADYLTLPGMPREKVLATVVRLLETTAIRVGNEEYVRQNHSFGLTTLRNRHVEVNGSRLKFHFRGKSGKKQVVEVHDPRVARVVKRCRDIPGYHLFEYLDEAGECHTVGSGDVNDYLREITGQEFTAKDFRTWAGTLLAVDALRQIGACESEAQARKNIVQMVDAVAERLGNTRAVCRKYYIHPAVIAAYTDGSLFAARVQAEMTTSESSLSAEEEAVLQLLRERLASETADPAPEPPVKLQPTHRPANGRKPRRSSDQRGAATAAVVMMAPR